MHGFVISVFLFLLVMDKGQCTGTGGYCYMSSQAVCAQAWTNLWTASTNKQHTHMCKYFYAVHKCTVKFMSTCNFKEGEKALYEADIVQVYTRKPYSCAILGGNVQYNGQYHSASPTKFHQHSYTIYIMPALILLIEELYT